MNVTVRRRRTALLALGALAASGCGIAAAAASQATAPPPGFEASFDYDRSAPLAPTAALQAQTDLVRIEKVTFRGADGSRVPALLALPKRAAAPFPCLVEGHALTSSKDEVFAEKAEAYATRGVAIFALDARYHGERKAGIGPLRAAARLDTLHRLFRLTVIDMRRGLDYLAERGICDPSRLGYEGRSMGGFMGSMLIGADTRIKAAVLLVSGADWRTYFSKSYALLGGPLRGRALDDAVRKMASLDPKYWIARASGRPVFMAAGRRDDLTPLASALALHRAARQPKQALVYDGGHDLEEPYGTRVSRASAAFLKRYLRIRPG